MQLDTCATEYLAASVVLFARSRSTFAWERHARSIASSSVCSKSMYQRYHLEPPALQIKRPTTVYGGLSYRCGANGALRARQSAESHSVSGIVSGSPRFAIAPSERRVKDDDV